MAEEGKCCYATVFDSLYYSPLPSLLVCVLFCKQEEENNSNRSKEEEKGGDESEEEDNAEEESVWRSTVVGVRKKIKCNNQQ